MTQLEELQNSDWYKTRPEIIQRTIDNYSPFDLFEFKDSKKQCHIIAYTEPDEDFSEVTLMVQKTGIGGVMYDLGLGSLDIYKVFGVKLTDLNKIK